MEGQGVIKEMVYRAGGHRDERGMGPLRERQDGEGLTKVR